MFNRMPIILLAIILAVVLFDGFIPLEVKSGLYAASLTIKSIIIFLLPFVIFGLLFKVMLSLSSHATRVILLIVSLVCCSNFISAFLSHYVGEWIYTFDLSLITPNAVQSLTPAWDWTLPELIANDKAMLLGVVLGILAGFMKADMTEKVVVQLDKLVNLLLKIFVYMIPIFVCGFVVKLQFDGVMKVIIQDYALIFVLVALTQAIYVVLLFLIANQFNVKKTAIAIKNMLPAALVAFSTMSSAVTMPLTILGVEKNAKNKNTARAVIPATLNIHLLGDCIAIIIFAYAIMKNFGVAEPSLLTYTTFLLYFIVARLSAAAVPGGGIFIILPLLQTYLNFNAEMLSLITALYILFDPVITTANMLGNSSFALILEKFKVFKKIPNKVSEL